LFLVYRGRGGKEERKKGKKKKKIFLCVVPHGACASVPGDTTPNYVDREKSGRERRRKGTGLT